MRSDICRQLRQLSRLIVEPACGQVQKLPGQAVFSANASPCSPPTALQYIARERHTARSPICAALPQERVAASHPFILTARGRDHLFQDLVAGRDDPRGIGPAERDDGVAPRPTESAAPADRIVFRAAIRLCL
jgi:hypothetical protein